MWVEEREAATDEDREVFASFFAVVGNLAGRLKGIHRLKGKDLYRRGPGRTPDGLVRGSPEERAILQAAIDKYDHIQPTHSSLRKRASAKQAVGERLDPRED